MSATSKFKGVTWHTELQKWRATITLPNKTRMNLGYFNYERDAAIAYDKMAARLGKPTNILKKMMNV